MNYSVEYNSRQDIITITIQGQADLGSIQKILAALAEKLESTNCSRVLIDMRSTEIKMSLMELIALPGMIQSFAHERKINLDSLQRAMVTQKNPRIAEMYEILVHYIGGKFERFQTIEEAKAWFDGDIL